MSHMLAMVQNEFYVMCDYVWLLHTAFRIENPQAIQLFVLELFAWQKNKIQKKPVNRVVATVGGAGQWSPPLTSGAHH